MQNLWNWVLRNFSNFLSFLSVILTIYFGLFYVPSYLKDVQKEKVENSKEIIEQTIKELVYSDSVCTYKDIEPLITSQEIILNRTFPISANDLLTEVQNSFFQDKFLPLRERTVLSKRIAVLKTSLPKTVVTKESHDDLSILITLLSIIFTLIVTILGAFSSFTKYKEEKQVQEEINSNNFDVDHIFPKSYLAMEYEESIISALKDHPGVIIKTASGAQDNGFDIEFIYNKKTYYVEIKYLSKSKLGTSSFRKFLSNLNGLEGEFWLVHNQDLTSIVRTKFDEFYSLVTDRRQIKLVKAENLEDFKSQLVNLLKD